MLRLEKHFLRWAPLLCLSGCNNLTAYNVYFLTFRFAGHDDVCCFKKKICRKKTIGSVIIIELATETRYVLQRKPRLLQAWRQLNHFCSLHGTLPAIVSAALL